MKTLSKTKILLMVFAVMFIGMTAYEVVKQLLFPNIGIWESHITTIVFSTIVGLVCGYILLEKFQKIYEKQEAIEQNLRKSEHLLKEAEHTALMGHWELNTNTGEIIRSEQDVRNYGRTPENMAATFEDFIACVHPDDREDVQSRAEKIFTNLTADDFEFRTVWPSGDVRTIHARFHLQLNENGQLDRLFGVNQDVTEQKKAEETLRKLSSAVEQSPNAIFITDIDGAIEYVNSRFTELTGYTSDEAIGQNPRILKSSETPPELFTEIWNTIQAGSEWRGEIKDRHKSGIHFWAYETIAPVKDDRGYITHYVATHEDITARKDAELAVQSALEKAEIANRAKSQLMANMSHELRTPLNAIIGFSSTMNMETFGPLGNEKYCDYADGIEKSGQHLLALINDILDVSAIEAAALYLQEEYVSAPKIIDASIRLIRLRAEEERVTISSSVDPDLPPIFADERRLKQSLLNLFSNAVKFTPEGGKVSVDTRLKDDGSLAITVSDTGVGMSDEEINQAMSTFGQVDSGLNRKHEGTGLGLPLTKGLVELHGGTFDIKSQKGTGTVITLTLPKERVIHNADIEVERQA